MDIYVVTMNDESATSMNIGIATSLEGGIVLAEQDAMEDITWLDESLVGQDAAGFTAPIEEPPGYGRRRYYHVEKWMAVMFSGARAGIEANQTIGTMTAAELPLEQVFYDVPPVGDSFINPTTSRYVIPLSGYYRLHAHIWAHALESSDSLLGIARRVPGSGDDEDLCVSGTSDYEGGGFVSSEAEWSGYCIEGTAIWMLFNNKSAQDIEIRAESYATALEIQYLG